MLIYEKILVWITQQLILTDEKQGLLKLSYFSRIT